MYNLETNVFEAIMLICFGTAWPLSIYKLLKTRDSTGKSMFFLWVVFIGYISGVLHKLLVNFNYVIILYIFNLIMVAIDIILTLKYRRKPADKGGCVPSVVEQNK